MLYLRRCGDRINQLYANTRGIYHLYCLCHETHNDLRRVTERRETLHLERGRVCVLDESSQIWGYCRSPEELLLLRARLQLCGERRTLENRT